MFWVVFYTDVYIETEIIVIIVIAFSFKYTICRQMGLYRTVLLRPGQGYCLGTGCSVSEPYGSNTVPFSVGAHQCKRRRDNFNVINTTW